MSTSFGTPPPPPPKPSGHSSGIATSGNGTVPRPAPPVPTGQAASGSAQYGPVYRPQETTSSLGSPDDIRGPEDGWLPEILKDKSTSDLQAILASPELQLALVHSPTSQHSSIPASTAHIQHLLSQNTALATALVQQEQHLSQARQHTQSRLLALRALERQWKQRQADQDNALRDFSASALYQKLAAAVAEQGALVRTLEEGWLLDEGGDGERTATEREMADIVRRTREARKVGYLRRERKERWDEGRIGGWRG